MSQWGQSSIANIISVGGRPSIEYNFLKLDFNGRHLVCAFAIKWHAKNKLLLSSELALFDVDYSVKITIDYERLHSRQTKRPTDKWQKSPAKVRQPTISQKTRILFMNYTNGWPGICVKQFAYKVCGFCSPHACDNIIITTYECVVCCFENTTKNRSTFGEYGLIACLLHVSFCSPPVSFWSKWN